MEHAFLANAGRGWLDNAEARTHMISDLPPTNRGLIWFDSQMLWQVIASIGILCGTVGGALILSCKGTPLSEAIYQTTTYCYQTSHPLLALVVDLVDT